MGIVLCVSHMHSYYATFCMYGVGGSSSSIKQRILFLRKTSEKNIHTCEIRSILHGNFPIIEDIKMLFNFTLVPHFLVPSKKRVFPKCNQGYIVLRYKEKASAM